MPTKKLLIIDDEKDFVETLAERLMAKGYNIIKAFNGKEGLDKVHTEKPDLVLLDIAMPEMDGFDVCRKLKIDEELKKIPVIILTAKFQPCDLEFGREMGAESYITKPVELDILTNKIRELLKKRPNGAKTRNAGVKSGGDML